MATKTWESGASPIAQANSFAFAGTWEADDLIRVIAGNKIKDLTAGSTTTATVVSNTDTNIDALDATDFPEIKGDINGVTASSVTTTLTLTANEPGVPFTITLTPLEAGGGGADLQTIEGGTTATAGTAVTANSGPFVYSTAANWSDGAVPAAGDTIHFNNASQSVLYGLSNAGATLTAMHVWQNYTGDIGLPRLNEQDAAFPEYRTDYLTVDCSATTIGDGEGQGSGRIKINNGTVQAAVTVIDTGAPAEADVPAFLWKGTHASNTFTAYGNASCGIAFFGGETATVATLTLDGNANVRCGLGVTLTTIDLNSGTLDVRSNIGGTITLRGGTVTLNGTATVAQMTCRGGTVVVKSTGTWSGNTILSGDGVLDFSQAPGNITITNPIEMYGPNCRIIDPNKRIVSLVVDFNEGANDGQVDGGINTRWTRGTPA